MTKNNAENMQKPNGASEMSTHTHSYRATPTPTPNTNPISIAIPKPQLQVCSPGSPVPIPIPVSSSPRTGFYCQPAIASRWRRRGQLIWLKPTHWTLLTNKNNYKKIHAYPGIQFPGIQSIFNCVFSTSSYWPMTDILIAVTRISR